MQILHHHQGPPESGDQEVLDLMNKGASVQEQIDSVVKANRAGIAIIGMT